MGVNYKASLSNVGGLTDGGCVALHGDQEAVERLDDILGLDSALDRQSGLSIRAEETLANGVAKSGGKVLELSSKALGGSVDAGELGELASWGRKSADEKARESKKSRGELHFELMWFVGK